MAAKKRPNRPVSYISSGIFDGVLLYVLWRLPHWRVPFITDRYPDILWAVTLSLGVQIGFYALLVLYHPLWLHYLAQVVFTVVSVLALGVILQVFPFAFPQVEGDWPQVLLRIFLIIVLVGSAVGGVVNLVRFFRSLRGSPQEEE